MVDWRHTSVVAASKCIEGVLFELLPDECPGLGGVRLWCTCAVAAVGGVGECQLIAFESFERKKRRVLSFRALSLVGAEE